MRCERTVLSGLLLILGFVGSACTKPGVKATGKAEVQWGGAEPTSWTGTCRYSTETRWSTSLPHILRLENAAGDALVIQSSDRFSNGRSAVTSPGDGLLQGRAMEGATVRGALEGTLDVSTDGGSMRIDITGVRKHRETVPFHAVCRLRVDDHDGGR